jgi:hypothetical protein
MKKVLISIYLGVSLFLSFLYFGLLYETIVRPQFKNLGTEGFIFWGFIIAIMLSLDVFIVSRFFKRKIEAK